MSKVDSKHLVAAVTVTDEGSLSKAAIKLNITQSAVSKQILALEEFLGHDLFVRNSRQLLLTPAGKVFVQHARIALMMQDRAVQLSREAYTESKTVLHLGKSPYVDPYLISALNAIQREEFPAIRLDVESNFSAELSKQVLIGVLDMAVLTEGNPDSQLSTLELATSPFYLLLREENEIARRKVARLGDLQGKTWVRFARHVHPNLYDKLTQSLEKQRVQPSAVHHVTTAEEAVQLVLEADGVATLTKTGAWRVLDRGMTIRPLIAEGLSMTTVLAIRSDCDSMPLTQFVKAVGRRLGGRQRTTTSA